MQPKGSVCVVARCQEDLNAATFERERDVYMRLLVPRQPGNSIEAAVDLRTVGLQIAHPCRTEALAPFVVDDAHRARHPSADRERLHGQCKLLDASTP